MGRAVVSYSLPNRSIRRQQDGPSIRESPSPTSGPMTASIQAPNRSPAWHFTVLFVFATALAGCAAIGQDSTRDVALFAEDTLISGEVLENSTACEVDATCYLRIEFADTSIVVLYGGGERPFPACTVSREVSDAAFLVQSGEVIDVVISRCASQGHYMRRLVRDTG